MYLYCIKGDYATKKVGQTRVKVKIDIKVLRYKIILLKFLTKRVYELYHGYEVQCFE